MDWGVPDWRDQEAYACLEGSSRFWAWQFLRRNPIYREFWKERQILSAAQYLDGLRAFCLIRSLQDPRQDERPRFVFDGIHLTRQSDLADPASLSLTFDLRYPLQSQFDAAAAYASDMQLFFASQVSVKIETKARPDKYKTYLQIIDATDALASRSQVSRKIFAKADDAGKTYDNHRAQAMRLRDRDFRKLAASPCPKQEAYFL